MFLAAADCTIEEAERPVDLDRAAMATTATANHFDTR